MYYFDFIFWFCIHIFTYVVGGWIVLRTAWPQPWPDFWLKNVKSQHYDLFTLLLWAAVWIFWLPIFVVHLAVKFGYWLLPPQEETVEDEDLSEKSEWIA